MTNTLVLEARYGGGRLELTPVPHPHDAAATRPTWEARLTGRGSAGHAVAGSRFDSVADTGHGLVAEMICPEAPWEDQLLHEFFDELYAERQGWDGEKSWVSQNDHLTLKAEHDHVNTVKLRIELRGIADPQWLAVVTVPVDPGVFHRIGANAKLFGDQTLEGAAESETA
jgi:hypothetical protein